MAWIWFSCFCCASENLSVIPAALAEDWIDFVLAVRQPLSEPTCEKPRVILAVRRCFCADLPAAVPASAEASRTAAPIDARTNHFFDTAKPPPFGADAEADAPGLR